MRKNIIRVAVAVAAAGVLSMLGVSGAGASGAATRAGPPAVHHAATVPGVGAVPGAQLWIKRYNGPASGSDGAQSVAVSPGGGAVFITGNSSGDYATVAYNAATGAQLWAKRYHGPGNGNDQVSSLAVSPGGGTVFVTGASAGATSDMDYATVAYNAATGAQQWVKRYNGPANGSDSAFSLAISPRGGTVFVTGVSYGATSGRDYATVAYNAATGAQQWVMRYTSRGQRPDSADGIAVSPRGDTVFVTGAVFAYTHEADYATVAYNAVTGAQLWVKRYNGPGKRSDSPLSLMVSPGGGTVFVTGSSYGATSSSDYATIAYNATTGKQLWVQRYNGPGGDLDVARSVAVSPHGGTVFVTGNSYGATSSSDYATIAYNATTGKQLWVQRYIGAGGDNGGTAVAVSPSGDRVFVTGDSWRATSDFDYITIAYSS